MSPVVLHLARALGLLAAAFGLGLVVKLSDLLEEGGYSWFPRAVPLVGAVGAGLGVGMLALGHAPLQLCWIAALLAWLLSGRALRVGRGTIALAMAVYLVLRGPRVAFYPWEIAFFGAVLVPLGWLHARWRAGALELPAALLWLVERRWSLLAVGYCVLFELDSLVVLGAYGFSSGHAFLHDETRLGRLARWGIRKRPGSG